MNHTAKKLLVGTVGAAGLFLATTATANADTTHKVAKNDTVWDLSQKYGVSIQAIEALNNIDQNSHLIITGQTLKVPAKDAQVSENNNTAQAADKKADTENTSDVTVKAGDTLWTLAQQYNTSVEKLRELNGLAADAYLIHPGNVLKINGAVQATQQPAQTEQPVQQQAQPEQPVVQQEATQEQAQEPQLVVSANHTTHTVQAGESLYSIAQAYGVTVDSLRAANNLGATLLVGQTLTINDPAKDPAQEAAAQQAAAQAQQEAVAQQAAQQQAAAQAQQEAAAQQATQQQAATQVQQPVQNQAPAQTQAPAQQTQQVQQQAQPAQVQQPQQQVVSTSADGAAIAAYAQSFIGTPYVWGGSTPSGFDCSGLTQYVYAHFGKQIGRNTIAQESAGAHIPVSQAQVGDLLFWGTPGSTYHVAIYLGGNSFVAAPEPGQSVKIGNMAYFMPSFAVHVN
ncbi:hypothetical protein FC48_GL000591 [Ligilactobacillus murinus DSM 20452 = NBRC 14221]|uniref:Cell wall-associated hydrolase n=1 Tax=Ligilactobacillus murinus DSM 20452 = NBRC 14221 TaxID=1423772 RepID=A0A0R2BNV0_9LACO|nr:C40 family peptidase [Ligilactobacillus murinus]KRM77803.1 hypothetical protein FC48_GL000591 [Ligilactobacillus murinus DSM 20452 = NBRC 14221]